MLGRRDKRWTNINLSCLVCWVGGGGDVGENEEQYFNM